VLMSNGEIMYSYSKVEMKEDSLPVKLQWASVFDLNVVA
jgi:hypothetical protein